MDDGIRTHDGRNHNPGLYQLSYVHQRVAIHSTKRMRHGAPGRIRTCNPRLRRPMLYPLSYGRYLKEGIGRGSRIRTCDPLLPKQMRYQTALLPAFADGCGGPSPPDDTPWLAS